MGLRALQPPVAGLSKQAVEAGKTRLQSAMRGLGTQGPVAPQQIAQAGAEAVQQQAKAQLGAREQEMRLAAGQAELGLQNQALVQRQALQQRKTVLAGSLRKAEDSLIRLGMSTKQQLFDASLRFEQDELGRTLFNERQLLDYAVTRAKTIEELQDYEQTVGQISERRLRLMQVAQQKIELELKQIYQEEQNELNQEAKLGLQRAAAAMEEKLKKDKAAAQNRAGMWSAIGGTVLAAGVAFIPGVGPALAPAAFSIGAGLGGAAAGATED